MTTETLKSWIQRGYLASEKVNGRWIVANEDLEAFRRTHLQEDGRIGLPAAGIRPGGRTPPPGGVSLSPNAWREAKAAVWARAVASKLDKGDLSDEPDCNITPDQG